MKKVELLSPAGNFHKLKIAIAYGADAVYAGVPKFSLRTKDNDFRKDRLKEAIDYTHENGKKIYLTMNIYAHNRKVNSFMNEVAKVAEWNPDALIMTDPGLIYQVKKEFPKLPIHLSTQANSTNWTSVQFWQNIGVDRIILSRELSIKEIFEIHQKVPDIELEAFVHGAICIAYSGRCLISNYLNHRDANQGTCTNSCRWEYNLQSYPSLSDWENAMEQPKPSQTERMDANYLLSESSRTNQFYPISEDSHGTYLMNAKDLCAIELLEEISDAGVVSFKIEGRTKSAYYTAMTTRIYRQALDDLQQEKPLDTQHIVDLVALSHRPYTTGFYKKDPKEFALAYDSPRSERFTHHVVGEIVDFLPESNRVVINVKNPIIVGMEVDYISPQKSEKFTISEMYKSDGTPINKVSGGVDGIEIFVPLKPEKYSYLCAKLVSSE